MGVVQVSPTTHAVILLNQATQDTGKNCDESPTSVRHSLPAPAVLGLIEDENEKIIDFLESLVFK